MDSRPTRRALGRLAGGAALAGALAAFARAEDAAGEAPAKKKRKKGWRNQTTFGSFGNTQGVWVTADGRTAFVSNTAAHCISVWTRRHRKRDWTEQTTFGSGPGRGASEFIYPQGVWVTTDGRTALVADYGNWRISVWTRSNAGSVDWTNQTTFGRAGSDPDQFFGVRGVSLTEDGLTAFVADEGNYRIAVWTRSSLDNTDWSNQATFGAEGSGPSQFGVPVGVGVTTDGLTALVADEGNHRIAVWTRASASSADWSNQTTFGGGAGSGPDQFAYPTGVFVTADGRTAFVADTNNHRISVWRRSGAGSTDWAPQTTFGSEGSLPSQFQYPASVWAAADGRTAFVADAGNARVSIWRRS